MSDPARTIRPDEDAILRRAARELQSGMLVNLGIGLPTRLPAYLDCYGFHGLHGRALTGAGHLPVGTFEAHFPGNAVAEAVLRDVVHVASRGRQNADDDEGEPDVIEHRRRVNGCDGGAEHTVRAGRISA